MAKVVLQPKETAITEFVKQLPQLMSNYALLQQQKSERAEDVAWRERQLLAQQQENESQREHDLTIQNLRIQEDREDKKRTHNTEMMQFWGGDNLVEGKDGFLQLKGKVNYTKTPTMLAKEEMKNSELVSSYASIYPSLTWVGEIEEDLPQVMAVKEGEQAGFNKFQSGTLSRVPYLVEGAVDVLPGRINDRDLDMLNDYFTDEGLFNPSTTVLHDELERVAKDVGILKEGEDWKASKDKVIARWAGFQQKIRSNEKLIGSEEYEKFRLEEAKTASTMQKNILDGASLSNERLESLKNELSERFKPNADGQILFMVDGEQINLLRPKDLAKLKASKPNTEKVLSLLIASEMNPEAALRMLRNSRPILQGLQQEDPILWTTLNAGIQDLNRYDEVVNKSNQFMDTYEVKDQDYISELRSSDDFSAFLAQTDIPSIVRQLVGGQLNEAQEEKMKIELAQQIKTHMTSEWFEPFQRYMKNVDALYESR